MTGINARLRLQRPDLRVASGVRARQLQQFIDQTRHSHQLIVDRR